MAENSAPAPDMGMIVTFYSYKGGTGRTMALANVAWILAQSGKRVLAVDWDLEAPGLHKFFQPFLDPDALAASSGVIEMINDYAWAATSKRITKEKAWYLEYSRIMPHAVSLDWSFQDGGELDFVSAGRQNRDYSSLLSSMDWDNFYERLGGGVFFDALRDDMKRHYDYILIDSRTGLSDIADICTVQMPDILVDCFTLSSQSIEGAASVARYIDERYRPRGITILPVPMRIEDAEQEKVEAGRAFARSQFDGFPKALTGRDLDRYWLDVEVPYRTFYAYEETLATFGDKPDSHGTMRAAYRRLAAAIAGKPHLAEPPDDEVLRLATLRLFSRPRPAPVSELILSYVSADRPWADWIGALLERNDFRVITHCADSEPAEEILSLVRAPDGGRTLRAMVLLSPHYAGSPLAGKVWAALSEQTRLPQHQDLVVVRLSRLRLAKEYENTDPVDIYGRAQTQAADTLLTALDRPLRPAEYADSADSATVGPRFPGLKAEPRTWNLAARSGGFTGRAALLEELRTRLLSGADNALPQALFGPVGIGKSQLALEYAYRFKADYDVVWWISAEQPSRITSGLADLARQLHHEVKADETANAAAACDALRRGIPSPRWLLIYDEVDGPRELDGYLPGGSGHVLITSRNSEWSQKAMPLEVTVFSPADSDALLMNQVPSLTAQDARQIGVRLGFMPLALQQAVAWLRETGRPATLFLEMFDKRELPRTPTGPQPVTSSGSHRLPQQNRRAVDMVSELLSQSSKAAARLFELCAFLAPDAISLELIYSDEMARLLSQFDKTLREKTALGKVVRELGRFELATVDLNTGCLQVHPANQEYVRSTMNSEEKDAACCDVHSLLLGALPSGGSENPQNWDKYEIVLPHIRPSRAVDSADEAVRQLLIDLVRYQWKRNRFAEALTLGDQLSERWAAELGPDHWQRLFLQSQLANVLRSQGLYEQALTLDKDVYARQLGSMGPDHLHTWITASGLGADLRALGRFAEALEQDEATYAALRELLDDDHPRTLSAANNLAVSYRLTGEFVRARELDERTLRARSIVLGPDQPDTLLSGAYLAQDMRDAGQFRDSMSILQDTLDKYSVVVGDNTIDALRISKSLAVSLRRAGHREEAGRLAERTYIAYLEVFPNTPDERAAALEHASCLSAIGHKERAYEVAWAVFQTQERLHGPTHPYTLAAAANVTGYLRGMDKEKDAHELGAATLKQLRQVLGNDHPFVLACAVNVANALAGMARYHEAEELETSTLRVLERRMGPGHPDTLACQANLSITLEQIGASNEWQRLRRRTLETLRTTLGSTHPAVTEAEDGHRISRDLEWQPI